MLVKNGFIYVCYAVCFSEMFSLFNEFRLVIIQVFSYLGVIYLHFLMLINPKPKRQTDQD